MLGLQGIMRAPTVAPSLGEFSLWKRRHRIPRLLLHKIACPLGRRIHYNWAKTTVKAPRRERCTNSNQGTFGIIGP